MEESKRPRLSAEATGIQANVVNLTNSTLIVQTGVDSNLTTTTDKAGQVRKVNDDEITENDELKPSWKAVAAVLSEVTPLAPETVTFGRHTFVCEARPYFHKFKMYWKGKCTDQKSGFVTVCKGVQSPVTSVQRAAAKLIREMVKQKKYPEPYDFEDMPTKE